MKQELLETVTMKKFGNSEFQQKAPFFYNLDVVISVGYRVKSPQGTLFRIWATQRLKEYIIKGFTLNDDRFKTGTSMNYFNECVERISKPFHLIHHHFMLLNLKYFNKNYTC